MAFDPNLLVRLGPSDSLLVNTVNTVIQAANAAPQPPQFWLYQAGEDTIAEVNTAGYFYYYADWVNTLIYNNGNFFRVGDVIYCACSDGNAWLEVTQIGGTIETEIQIANPDSIDTDAIQDGAVTLDKLDDAIAPAAVIKYFNQETTAGGAAAENFIVAGATALTDIAFAQMVDNGANNVTILEASIPVDNTLRITFSADPGNDAVFNYQIIRTTA